MKQKLYLLLSFFLINFYANAQAYRIQVSSLAPLTGGNTYIQNATANSLQLNVNKCAFGANQPQISTNYTITWYSNTVNSTTGGTIVSSTSESTQPFINFPDTQVYTPSTSVAGTRYYYAILTGLEQGCATVTSLTSTTQQVNVVLPATHLNFDGVDDIVNCGNSLNSVIDPLNKITVEAWVNTSTTSGLGVIIGNYANSNQSEMQFLLRRDNANYAFWISGNPGIFKVVNATNAVVVNTWQHVAGVWNGSDLKIYVNGNLMGTTTGVTESSFATTTNTIMIGNNQAGSGSEKFTGSIDEVRIWDAARTIEQIKGSRFCELQGSESGLKAYYKFNQGTDAQDNTGVTTLNAAAGTNGILTNFALTGTVSNWLAGSPVTTGSIVPSNATVSTPVVYMQNETAAPLTATIGANGSGLLWYTTATSGSGITTAPTPNTTAAGNTSYWVASINANGCESPRTEIVVTVNALVPATHLNFDGVDDVINLGSGLTSYFTGKTRVTIQAWVRSETNTGLGTIVGNYNFPTNIDAMQMMLRRDNGNYAFWLDSGSGYTALSAAGSVIVNTWQQITGTWDGTTMKIYINGVLANSAVKTGIIPSKSTSFSIGSNIAEKFDGDIDEVKLWNIALTASDVMNTMNCEAQTQPELVAYYKFNQGNDNAINTSTTSLTDSSGNSYTGTLTNFALAGSTSNWKSGSTITTGTTCTVLNNESFNENTNFSIYPNPTKNNVNIDVLNVDNTSVEVFDIKGRKLFVQKLNNSTNTVNIENLAAGVYLFKIISNQAATTIKVVKQ